MMARDGANIDDISSRVVGLGLRLRGSSTLWPNPNRGDAFFLQLPSALGQVSVTITDATGRLVLRSDMPASFEPLEVVLSTGIAAGTYLVGVVTHGVAETKRLVVERQNHQEPQLCLQGLRLLAFDVGLVSVFSTTK